MSMHKVQDELMIPVAELGPVGISTSDPAAPPLQRDLERGLRFAHIMMSVNQFEGREGAVYAHALAELLVNKGVVGQEELQTMMDQVRQQFEELPAPKVMLSKCEDKYSCQQAVDIDCANRVHLCKARCCTFTFYLSEQDLDEGIVKWDYGRPYWIQRHEGGHCVHCEPGTYHCQIHAYRPYVCRAYDCRNDKRIWLDFDQMIPASEEPRPDNSPDRTPLPENAGALGIGA